MPDFLNLLVAPPDSSLLYTGHYDYVLVALSVAVAIFASYAALLVSQQVVSAVDRRTRRLWIAVGGLCMGIGIWAMHFVGMLAFSLPCGSSYDSLVTVLSMIPGVLASTLAMTIISRRQLSHTRLALGGLLLGAGIGTMHYSGMAAMKLDGLIRYDLKLFVLSILVAVALATLALWISARLQALPSRWRNQVRIVSAVVLGSAVSGMHYTAMAAAYFISDGDPGIADSHVTPTFLASMVLTATVALIVITLAASYVARPSLLSVGRSFRVTVLMVLGWAGIAWLSSTYYFNAVAGRAYTQEIGAAERDLDELARNIDEKVVLLKGVARVQAFDDHSRKALAPFDASRAPSSLPREVRKQRWSQDARLAEMGRLLAMAADNLGADAVWLMNAAGDCVSASNAGQSSSFVGTNFADRQYFRQAIAGKIGHQYALGRVSKVPGLYYSAPVLEGGRPIGVVTVKRDIGKFSGLTSAMGVFLSDNNGVVVLAQNKAFEQKALPDAAIHGLSTEERLRQYGRADFGALRIEAWQPARFPSAVRIEGGDTPVALVSRVLPEDAITVHVARSLIELARVDFQRNWLFGLLSLAGGTLIVAASAVLLYLRQSQKIDTDLRVAAAAFEVQAGILITDADGIILRVNQAFTETTGYEAADAIGNTPGILRSGLHDDAFYAGMWEAIKYHGVWEGEVWNRRKNGELYPEWLNITAVFGSDGAITNYVGTISDISERKQAEEEIKLLAFYDSLTRLPNRRLLTDRLQQAMTASTRSGRQGALLFIDLDNFKTLNDTLGHDKGDLLLEQVAHRLVDCVREGDTVARFGGDEFVVMLEDLSERKEEAATQTRAVGEKILAALNQSYRLAGMNHHSTSSIGATLFSGHQDSIDELLKQADLAMYQAKAAGRNVMRFFDQVMQAVVNARATLEADFRLALRRGEFVLRYQPQVDINGRLIGAEALVRWQHPERGMVSPVEFIPLAEETGLILPLGLWVLEAACTQLAWWSAKAGMATLTLAVNASARQFRHPDFVEQVLAVVERTGVDPKRLKLEITESLLLEDVEDVIAKMAALKAAGVGFALDDFGTGYSSLSYLKRLPLDQLKIDQSFVRDVLSDPNDAAIARTIIALARSLGLAVIAEGVETEAQRAFLAQEGCQAYQGYLFGYPSSAEEIDRLVA